MNYDYYDRLLDKAKEGTITSEEVKEVANKIKEGIDKKELYTQLYIIGRSFAYEYEDLVAKYIIYKEDPMISKIAIQVLCDFWGKTKKYLNYVKDFVKKVDWDEDDDVRLVAISTLGWYLRENRDKESLKLIFDIFKNSDDKNSDKEKLIRDCAYKALAIAYGKNIKEIPFFKTDLDWEKDIDKKVIEWAEKEVIQG